MNIIEALNTLLSTDKNTVKIKRASKKKYYKCDLDTKYVFYSTDKIHWFSVKEFSVDDILFNDWEVMEDKI